MIAQPVTETTVAMEVSWILLSNTSKITRVLTPKKVTLMKPWITLAGTFLKKFEILTGPREAGVQDVRWHTQYLPPHIIKLKC